MPVCGTLIVLSCLCDENNLAKVAVAKPVKKFNGVVQALSCYLLAISEFTPNVHKLQIISEDGVSTNNTAVLVN